MYEVLIEVDVRGPDRQQGLDVLHQRLAPAIEQLPGFQSGTWLTGSEQGRGVSLTLWDTRENALMMADRLRLGSSPAVGAFVIRCELREVRSAVWSWGDPDFVAVCERTATNGRSPQDTTKRTKRPELTSGANRVALLRRPSTLARVSANGANSELVS